MKDFRQESAMLRISFLLVFMAVGVKAEAAETQEATAALKACFEAHMPAELSKSKPKSDSLIGACAKEYQRVIRSLPPGAVDEIAHFVKEQVAEQLEVRK